MKVKIHKEEWWPVYIISEDGWAAEIEMDSVEIEEYRVSYERFSAIQDIMFERYRETKKGLK